MTALKQYRIGGTSAAELVRSIEDGVASGALRPGQPLPSVRRLADEVNLSPVTVAAGLAELRRRGIVVSEPRRGTRIGDGPPIGSVRAPLPAPAGARDLSRGNPDPALLPDLASALSRLVLPVRMYGETADVPELIEIASGRLRADGVPADSLCVVSGALDGVERVLDVHVRPGDRVAVENPGYAAMFDLLRARGLVVEAVGVDERGMRPDELRAALARGSRTVLITPRGQNPTGAALDARRARELRAVLAAAPQTLVVEDDHLGELAGCPLHTTVGGTLHWAATRSVAKALGPDLRLAILAGDEHTLARVQGRQRCGPGWVSHVLQRLVLALLEDAAVTASIEHASAVYSARRERLISALTTRGVHAIGTSGLNVWVPVGDETGVITGLLQRGWVLAPGAPYRLTGSAPGVRATTAALPESQAETLADDLADVLAAHAPRRTG